MPLEFYVKKLYTLLKILFCKINIENISVNMDYKVWRLGKIGAPTLSGWTTLSGLTLQTW